MKRKLVSLARCLTALCCLLGTAASYGQFDPSTKLPVDPEVKIGKLSNGLTYYIRKNAKPEKKVQLRLVVNAGSVLEDADQLGLAHMMEHMNFNGSAHFPKNELVSYLQSIGVQFGADLNAYTSFDETVYILPIPTDDPVKIEKGFTILEDWAAHASLDTAEINKERGVVLEESRMRKGATERMGKKYFPVLFNGSLYSERLPIGKDSIIQHFKPEALERFYKTWYRPDLMAVVVVGDIDPALAEQQIHAHFDQLQNPPGELQRPSIIPIADRVNNTAMVLTDKEQTANILQVYNYIEKAEPITTWGDYRKSVTEGLFNALVNQRLSELSQQPDAPFILGATMFYGLIRGYRSFVSFAMLGDKPAKGALDALITTTESVKKFGFLATELERAKKNMLAQAEQAFNNSDKMESGRLVLEYVAHFLSGAPIVGSVNRYAFLKKTLAGIKLEEVNALAGKTESSQGKFALLMANEKSKPALPDDPQLVEWTLAAHKLPVKAYEEKAVVKKLFDKLPTPGRITNTTTNTALGTTDLTLNNGITVTLKPTEFKNDEIHMDGWRWGGSHKYSLADKQTTSYFSSIIRSMGVKDISAIDLHKLLAGRTLNVTPYLNEDDEGIEGTCNAKELELFFQLVHLYFTSPRKDTAVFKSFVTSQKSMMANMLANPNLYYADTINKITYAGNPWAPKFPTPADFDNISLDRMMDIYKNIFSNGYGMHFTFVGNIDMDKLKPLLETYLASLPASPMTNSFKDVGLRPVKGIINTTVKRGTAKKSQVNVIFTGEGKYSKDEALKLRMLTEALNIKIIEKLREDMSGVYYGTMSGSLINRPYNHYRVETSFPCGPENVTKLTAALFDIIKDAQDKGIEEKDLNKVKETLKKQYDDQITTNNNWWLLHLSRSWIEQDDPAWILQYKTKVDAVTSADLKEGAKKYLNMKNYIHVVLNPEN